VRVGDAAERAPVADRALAAPRVVQDAAPIAPADAGVRRAVPPPGGAGWPTPRWLCAGPIASIGRNRGGSSITFKLRFEGGGKAAFKPDQEAGFSRFRAELAAYRLSELLGYGRVPPSCERALAASVLKGAAGEDPEYRERLERELRVTAAGMVRGAAILWVDGIRELDLRPRNVPDHRMARQLSDMIVFDELAGNWDRWSGGNVFTDEAGTELVLIDNAAGFGPIGRDRRRRMDAVLAHATRPSPALLTALAELTAQSVSGALEPAGYGARQVHEVLERRDRILARGLLTR
jgi:hypothetical protein